jgi:serine/threonine protein kinase/Tfp pilus assembly protein PilF
MTPARFQTIEEIFLAALEQEPDQISAFLDTACDGDAVLRREVEALLASDQRAGRFIERSTVGLATKIIENRQGHSLIGQNFGHYKISKRIGSGGMGEVYLAADVTAGRKAALKLLPMRFTGDAERLKRFQQEAHAVVALNHPNILTIYEIGQDHSAHYIASELIEGETLRERLMRGRMEVGEAVDVAIQVASALDAAHHTGIVHRDIKPENIMLRPDGYVKVLDFGIAKLAEQEVPVTTPRDEALLLVETNLGSVLGTVRYMSPEQACGGQVDRSTDIWSLGIVFYEMITGHAPFNGDTPGEVMSSILEKEPRPLTSYLARAPAELQQIISKTLRKDREDRYHSAHDLLKALKDLRHKLEVEAELQASTAALPWLRWIRSPAALVLVLLVAALATAVATLFLVRVNRQKITSPAAGNIAPSAAAVTQLPEKSIAVLPFHNLSKEEENAFFAGGVQDEILANLAKVSDLKVISRTSVMKYKSDLERNLREIAKALGVSHVVEGSVQRAGGRVRVNVQLIDARNDANLWAEHYDRDVADVFAVQTEIAQQIADQLKANLSSAEKAAIAERPTTDLVAYAFYTKAKEIDVWDNWEDAKKSIAQKVELLEKATQRDPNFALAYCALAKAQADLGNFELAKKGAEAALRVRPDLGEGHRELARYYYYTSDFDRAHDELIVARGRLPNDSETFRIAAEIDRIQNRWDASLANLQKAIELDPRNVEVAWHLERTYLRMRRYSELEQLLTKEAATDGQEEPWINMVLAEIKLAQGDPVAAQSLLEQVPLDFSPTGQIWDTRFTAALYLRDYDAADHVIAATPARWAEVIGREHPKSWAEGQIARARDGKQKALAVFAVARKKLDATLGDKPKDEWYFALAAGLDAACDRKEEAIREALHAVDLKPIAKDSYWGPALVTNLALVYAWTGERDRALEQLEIVATIPGLSPTYGDLLLNPCWDDLRGDKRFDKIIAAAKAASR